MKHLASPSLLALALAALPGLAPAQVAYTATAVHLRAGPAREYPAVAVLPPGFEIVVQGCLSDYTWCDVLAGTDRGWLYAGNIQSPYANTYVPVLDYGAVLGIAVVGFILGDYWFHHYRERPWYPQRQRWLFRPVPPPDRDRLRPPRPDGSMPGFTHHPPRRIDGDDHPRRPPPDVQPGPPRGAGRDRFQPLPDDRRPLGATPPRSATAVPSPAPGPGPSIRSGGEGRGGEGRGGEGRGRRGGGGEGHGTGGFGHGHR